jgi:hypothetical protein
MAKIAEYVVKVHSTKDRKKLKEGIKEYDYGTINIRDPNLRNHIGKTVKVKVESYSKSEQNQKRGATK